MNELYNNNKKKNTQRCCWKTYQRFAVHERIFQHIIKISKKIIRAPSNPPSPPKQAKLTENKTCSIRGAPTTTSSSAPTTTTSTTTTTLKEPVTTTREPTTASSRDSSARENLASPRDGQPVKEVVSVKETITVKESSVKETARKGGVIFPSVKNKPSIGNTTFTTDVIANYKDIRVRIWFWAFTICDFLCFAFWAIAFCVVFCGTKMFFFLIKFRLKTFEIVMQNFLNWKCMSDIYVNEFCK